MNCVMIDKSEDPLASLNVPLYADGYPGIMFQQAGNGLYLEPRHKKLSGLFLYGQTLNPVALTTNGPFQYVVFQLYPFASKHLLNVNPRELNDDCFDLLQLQNISTRSFYAELLSTGDLSEQIEIMSDLVEALVKAHEVNRDDRIQKAIHLIIKNEGLGKMSDVRDHVYLTERTFERNFMNEVGLTPKQFARIIQFQTSLSKVEDMRFANMSELAFDSGFSDQSHFIRVFKSYTGLSPKQYQRQALLA